MALSLHTQRSFTKTHIYKQAWPRRLDMAGQQMTQAQMQQLMAARAAQQQETPAAIAEKAEAK
jgi:hypothetical protein